VTEAQVEARQPVSRQDAAKAKKDRNDRAAKRKKDEKN
jgi:hypothetical protein